MSPVGYPKGRPRHKHTPGVCWFFIDKTTSPARFTCREHGTTLGDLFNAKDLPEQCRKARDPRSKTFTSEGRSGQ